MLSLVKNTTIRQKIWGGFALILAVLALVSLLSLLGQSRVRNTISEVVGMRQPTALLSMDLSRRLQSTASSFGFYLLSKAPQYKTEFLQGQNRAEKIIQRLRGSPAVSEDPEARSLVAGIADDFAHLRTLGARILAAAGDDRKNFPGVAYAAEHINPLSQQFLQLVSQMLMSEEEEEASEERRALYGDLADLRYSWANVMNGVRAYLAFRRQDNLNDARLYLTRAGELLKKIAGYGEMLTFDQQDALEQLQRLFADFGKNYRHLQTIHGSARWRTDTWLVKSEMGPLFGRIEKRLEKLVSRQRAAIESSSQVLADDASNAATMAKILFAIGLLMGLGVAYLIANMVVTPLQRAAQAMDEIAHGDGDLTRRLEARNRDEIGLLSSAFNRFVNRVQSIVSQTSKATGEVIGAVARTTSSANDITRLAEQQERETCQVAAAIEQMTGTTAEIAVSAQEAETSARSASGQAGMGQSVVAQSADAIQGLADEVQTAATALTRLEQDMATVGSILDVIKGIAEQTNLLALNAAIEAARAGEQGRGFAVVAGEVRSLANRTQESTVEIEEMIERLRSAAQDAVTAMQTGREKAGVSVEQIQQVRQTFDAISAAVEHISEVNTAIARASGEQKVAAEEVVRSVEKIRDGSRAMSDSAHGSRDVTQRLGTLAAELQQVISQFRISGDEGFDFNTARSAHLAWKARLRDFLDGRASLSRQEAVSHHDCVLGKWYYAEGLERYGEIPEMKALEAPHAELHRTVGQIIALKESGRAEEAEAAFGRIATLSTEIIALLDRVEASIGARRDQASPGDAASTGRNVADAANRARRVAG